MYLLSLRSIKPLLKHYRSIIKLTGSSRGLSQNNLVISDEVKCAIQAGNPVVALESTIITHGMPYPQNMEMAVQVEQVIRDIGVIPATIAAINGQFKIGLSNDDLQILAQPSSNNNEKKVKISRRDIAYTVVTKATGGTTVSGTMIMAHAAGIKFFATGGIGGVHRGAELSMDISADLDELSKTPVCVICAGIKSILDIPKSLEYLETKGVPIIVYNHHQFPSFFTNDSGIKSPFQLNDIQSIAQLYHIQEKFTLTNGMIVAVPNPDPVDSVLIQNAIDLALQETREKHINGYQITPYLLSRIEQLTHGKSLESNIKLVLNNAKTAARLALAYSQLKKFTPNTDYNAYLHTTSSAFTPSSLSSSSSSSHLLSSVLSQSSSPLSSTCKSTTISNSSSSTPTPTTTTTTTNTNTDIPQYPVLIFGGAVIDTITKSYQPLLPNTSNPGTVTTSYGGVGRNIAHNLAVLHKGVKLVSVIGNDESGRQLLHHSQNLGINCSLIRIPPFNITKYIPTSTTTNTPTTSTTNIPTISNTSTHSSHPSSSSSSVTEAYMSTITQLNTSSYVAIHDHNGDLYSGIADMNTFQYINNDYILSLASHIRTSALIVVDGNLSPEPFHTLLKLASTYSIPVFFEPTSNPKCILPVISRTIHMVDVLKPNFSELVTLVQKCFQENMILENKAVVQHTLNKIQNLSTNEWKSISWTDVRILAVALYHVMTINWNDTKYAALLTSINNTTIINSSSTSASASARMQHTMSPSSSSSKYVSSTPHMTAEGHSRKIRGKHVIVSLGSRGVLWCGLKSAVTKVRAGSHQTTYIPPIMAMKDPNSVPETITTVLVDDQIAVKIFPPLPIQTTQQSHINKSTNNPSSSTYTTDISSHQKISSTVNTNGAGDAFCAGVISALLENTCTELDTECIIEGLKSATMKISSSIVQ